MTQEVRPEQDEAAVGGDQQEVSVEDLKSELAKASAEAAKYKSIAKKTIAERDEIKAKAKTSQDDDYKALWQEEVEEKNKLLATAKGAAVNNAVTAQLTKAGILADAIEAATGLIDQELIEWDKENGIDSASVVAAVAKLKSKFGFMFEKKVAKTDPKAPADGTSANANEMKRSDFDKLDPLAQYERIKKGIKVVD
jgi:hypothetical protein